MIVKTEVSISKDVDDIFLLLLEIVKLRKAGKNALEIGGSILDELMEAIDGISNISDDLKEDMAAVIRTGAVRSADIVAVLMAPSADQ